jgi:hypothetical protein
VATTALTTNGSSDRLRAQASVRLRARVSKPNPSSNPWFVSRWAGIAALFPMRSECHRRHACMRLP